MPQSVPNPGEELCHQAVVDWFILYRDVPACMWTRREKMSGPRTVQMDKTLIRGKRNINKGRLLREPEAGDESPEDTDVAADVAYAA